MAVPAVQQPLAMAQWPTYATVEVLASAEECVEIGAALSNSEIDVRPFEAELRGTGSRLAAVLVSDAAPDALRLCGDLAGRRPVVLLSSCKDFAFRLAAARAGVRAILERPFDPIEAANCLKAIEGDMEAQPLSILLVDDDALMAALHAEILRAAGMAVTVVTDPTAVLEAVERLRPDLILMDIEMPGVDGVELAKVIRLSRQFVSIPILFLSAERDEARQSAARRLGGDDFITKPIDPRKLITQVGLRGERAKVVRTVIETDALTGLLDRERFHERLNFAFDTGRSFSLGMLDIDHFKAVNDTYGHAMGDGVIRRLAQILSSGLRRGDIVGRCGGEEFAVLLPGADLTTAGQVMDRLRERFAQATFRAGDRRFGATFSAGVAAARDFSYRADLLAGADAALYAAKRAGRNRIRLAATTGAAGRDDEAPWLPAENGASSRVLMASP